MTFTLPALSVLKPYVVGVVIATAVGLGTAEYKEIERKGAEKILTHQVDSLLVVQQKHAAQDSVVALQTASAAQHAKTLAAQQIAAGKALQAHTDSVARSASHERDSAVAMLADSTATADRLRSELYKLVFSGHADSVARATQSVADSITIHDLLATITADSVALHAEQCRSAALQALAASTAQKVALLEKYQPSAFGQFVKLAAVAVIGVEAGRLSAGKWP